MRIHLTPMTWFLILTVIAIGLALGLPPDPHAVQSLHTTVAAYRAAVAVLLIPYILIWYASFYAFAKLREYSRPIKDTKDGAAFHKLAAATGVLAFSLVIPTILALILSSIASHHPPFKPADIIITNYVNAFPAMAAFLLLLGGARSLLRLTRNGIQRLDLRWYAPWFILLSVAFSHLVIENEYRSNSYHLSVWVLVATIIVPYLYGWMVGLMSAYELHWYAKTVKGLLYRKAVRQFAQGITVTIFGSIAIQFVNNTIAQRLGKSLGSLLLVDYILVVIVATGLILMALGTKKLKRIEEL